MTRHGTVALAACAVALAACGPSWNAPAREGDGGMTVVGSSASLDGGQKLGADGGRPLVSPDGSVTAVDMGPPTPATVAMPTFGAFRTVSEPRSVNGLTLVEDGFDLSDAQCVKGICATGKLEP